VESDIKTSLRAITVSDLFVLMWKLVAASFLVCIIVAIPVGVVTALIQRSQDRAAAAEARYQVELNEQFAKEAERHTAAMRSINPGDIPSVAIPLNPGDVRPARKHRKQKSTSACLSPDGYVDCNTNRLLP
jgi:uncharacterized membrane protein YraQ (UPF0718 family)